MKKIFFLILLAGCIGKGGKNHDAPLDKDDSPAKDSTGDSIRTVQADQTANVMARVARYVYAGNDILDAKPGIVTLQGAGNTGNYQWSEKSGPTTVVINNPNILKPTANLVAGKYWFLLTGIYSGRQYRDSVKVIVTGTGTTPPPIDTSTTTTPNRPPTVNAGPDKSITLPNNVVTLNAVATDPEGGTILYKWSTGAITPSITLTYSVPTTQTISVTVTDNKGLTATDNVVITVMPAVVTPPPSTNGEPSTTPKMFNDFETSLGNNGTMFNKYIQQPYEGKAPGPFVTLSSERAASGSKSARFYMTSDAAQATGESHAQLTKIEIETITEGTEHTYSCDYYLQAPFTTDLQYIRQWHHDASNYSPPAAIATVNGQLQWNYFTEYGGNGKDVFIPMGSVPIGQWFHLTVHMIFSSVDGKALNEVWLNGVQVLKDTHHNMFPGIGDLEMIGTYHWQWKSTSYKGQSSVIFIDNYKMW